MMIRAWIFALFFGLSAAPAQAENLPWKEAQAPAAEAAPPPSAKFFPINPAVLMRPPVHTYSISGTTPKKTVKPAARSSGTASVSEDQARKLLEMYTN